MGYLFLPLIGLTASYAFDLFSFDSDSNANDEAPVDDETPSTFYGTDADDTVVLDLDGDNYSTGNQPQQDEANFYVTDYYDEYNLGQGNDELVQEFGDWGNEGFVVNGEEGNDRIISFSYLTELNGGSGNDSIRGMVTDTILGGEGDDVLQMELDQDLNDSSGGGAWGEDGDDTLRIYSDIYDLPDHSYGSLHGGDGQDNFEIQLNLRDFEFDESYTSQSPVRAPSGVTILDFDPSAGDSLEINLLDFRTTKESDYTAELGTETRYNYETEENYEAYVLYLEFFASDSYPATTTITLSPVEMGDLTLDDITFTYLQNT